MSTRVTIYNRDGTRATEIECACTRRWVLNAIGQATIYLPLNDPKLTLDNTNFGQYVYIEHPRAGAWGGKLFTPYRENDTEGYAEMTAYTGEYILKQRRVVNVTFSGTAGQIFEQLIGLANQQEDTRIRVGSVENAGLIWTETVDVGDVYSMLVSITRKSNQYWSIEPVIEGGSLIFEANWHQYRGANHPAAVRIEDGTHTEAARGAGVTVQGDLANDVLVYGSSGSQASKIFAPAIDMAARAEWGLNQLTIGISDAEQSSIDVAAQGILRQYSQPIFTPKLVAVDVPCGGGSGRTYDFCNLGDTFIYHRITGRYKGDHRVRVMAREFDERAGKLELTTIKVTS